MNKHAAFLRAINVAGHAKIKMSVLGQVFIEAGCKTVRTYIQSGNILFETPEKDVDSCIQKIQDKLCELIGTEATVIYRTLHEIENIMRTAPFKDIEPGTDAKLYVTFLSRKPRQTPALPLLSSKEALEVVKVTNLEIFIVSRKKKNGFYGFPNNFIEKEFGVPATTRNWTTVTKIAKLLSG
jgi:uncharacterized protein (DUF1697 family)